MSTPATTRPTTPGPAAPGWTADRYIAPGRIARGALNPVVGALVRLGAPLGGAHLLEVRGRTSGEWRSVPVNLLADAAGDFLVSPRGATQWVRNVRAAGGGRLRRGRRRTAFRAVEVADADKPPILRAYLSRWAGQVGDIVDGADADTTEERLAELAPGIPVFRIALER